MTVAKRSYGIDVSSFQGTDLAKYANLGAKFAFVKVSEGLDYRNPKAQAQIKSAKDNGMMVSGYHYARFSANSGVAVQEGNYAVNSAKAVGLNVGSYLALDYEQGSGNETGGDAGANTTAILAFLDTIVSAGYQPLLYSGAALLKSKIDTGKVLAKYPNCLWVAFYPVSGATSEANFGYFPSMNGIVIWQFTDNWRGLNVDGNISLIDLKTDGKPVAQPSKPAVKQSTPQSWVDDIGDTWYKEEGKFYPNGTINIRYGARTTSDIIGTVTKGDCVKYDAYSRHGGYVWIRQPRADGEPGFLVCRQANTPWGTFK